MQCCLAPRSITRSTWGFVLLHETIDLIHHRCLREAGHSIADLMQLVVTHVHQAAAEKLRLDQAARIATFDGILEEADKGKRQLQ